MKKTIKSKYTNDFVPIKSITNGMVILDNNKKLTGIKIMPRNIFILDQGTQNAIIDNLKNAYNMIDYEFWIIAADRPVDINLFLSQLQLLFNSTQDQIKRKMIMEDINKANLFMNNNIVDTEYFLLFVEKDTDKINKRIRQLINGFANAGLTSHQVTNDDLRIILDNFLNGGQTTTFGTVIG
ncbi:MAG: hypothetical protein J6K21_00275 [Bacilli bacterium]|nr:hypothetical protein [Bacilli bacterium]